MANRDPYRSAALVESDETPPPADEFGEFRSTHLPDPGVNRRRNALVIAFAFAFAFAFVLIAFKPAVTTLPRALALLAGFLVVGLLFRRALPPATFRVSLYERGVAVVYPDGSWKSIPYAAVDAVWYSVPSYLLVLRWRKRIDGLILMTRERRKLPIPLGVADNAAVLRAVLAGCTQPLVAEADAALRTGEELDFERARIGADYIVIDGVRIPWSDVVIDVRVGAIDFSRDGVRFAKITCDRVPHPRLFAHLVRKLASRANIVDRDYAATW